MQVLSERTTDDSGHPQVQQVAQIYAQMGSTIHFRPLARFQQLLQPWRADEKAFVSLLEWHGLDQTTMTAEDQRTWSSTSGMYGAYLVK